MSTSPKYAAASAECKAANEALAASEEVKALLARLTAAQAASELTNVWDSREGRATESAMGYLRMALEAVGVQF